MAKFEGPHNLSNPGQLRSKAQAHWSQKRAWPGDEVTLSLRAENVKEGASADLQILAAPGLPEIEAVKGQKINAGKLDHKHKLEWKGKPFGKHREFVIQATIDAKLESEPSPKLWVDLEPPLVSA